MDFSKHIGDTVKSVMGHEVKLVAYVPEARESEQIVGLNSAFGVKTYSKEGRRYGSGNISDHDLRRPTRKIRMRAYENTQGWVVAAAESRWLNVEAKVKTGRAAWVSEPFDVEIDA